MYSPSRYSAREDSKQMLARHDFGTLITVAADDLHTTHLPYLYDEASHSLVMHLAAPNPHWKAALEHPRCRFVVHGAHGYISPAWYSSRVAVPTWNYEAVHVDGRAEVVRDPEHLRASLERFVERFESSDVGDSPWRMSELDDSFVTPRLSAIVGVVVHIDKVEAKQKLSQERPAAERAWIIEELRRVGDHPLARAMEACLELPE